MIIARAAPRPPPWDLRSGLPPTFGPMEGEAPFPLDQSGLSTDVLRVLARHGGHFDGDLWLLMEETVHPYEEIFLAAAVERETVLRTANTMGVRMALVETAHGCVLRVSLTFVDHPVDPTEVETFLNPGAADLRRWLQRLVGQTHMNVLQLDCHTGEQIKWTRLGISPGVPDAAQRVLDVTWEEPDPDLGRWVAAVRHCQEHLGPPPGHVRRPTWEGARAGRNEPCPCGSGRKFKHCHGS